MLVFVGCIFKEVEDVEGADNEGWHFTIMKKSPYVSS